MTTVVFPPRRRFNQQPPARCPRCNCRGWRPYPCPVCWRHSASALAITKQRIIHLYTTRRLTLGQTQRIFNRWLKEV